MTRYIGLVIAGILAICACNVSPAVAQKSAGKPAPKSVKKSAPTPGQKPVPLANPVAVAGAREVVERYLKFTFGEWVHPDSVSNYAVDEFGEQLTARRGEVLAFSQQMQYSVGGVYSIRPGDSLVMVPVLAIGDSIPGFGPMKIEWVCFVRMIGDGQWRISSIRRQVGIEDAAEKLRALDSTSEIPASLKPIVIREWSAILLSNSQLRENFLTARPQFDALVKQFQRKDSLSMLARFDKQVSQLNYTSFFWEPVAQEVPQKAIDEFMATASKEEIEALKTQLRYADRLRRSGRDSVARAAKKIRISLARLDTIIGIMSDLRISFANARLPWKGSVQFTVAGVLDNVIGYLYAPEAIPWISPEEYYYLEELGEGWWIFRST